MALTRVAPAGIGSTPGTGYVIGDSFLHATGLNATNAYYTGIVTAQTFRVIGDFQVDGTTTTLDTVLTEVDKLEVGANNNTVGVAITQSGTGDILNLYDGSTEVFSVTDGGKVKIGTTTEGSSSADDLTVATSAETGITIRSGTSNPGNIFFSDGESGLSEYRGFITYAHADDSLRFATVNTERLRITSGGNLGINQTSPDKLLHISSSSAPTIRIENTSTGAQVGNLVGSLEFEGQDNNAAGVRAKIDAEYRGVGAATAIKIHTAWENETTLYESAYFTKPTIKFTTNNVERLRITSTGNVGINDTNPTAKLSVIGNAYVSADSFTGENSGIFFSGWNDYGAGVYGRNSGNDLVMNAGASEKVRITSAGNVGIGTDNPDVYSLGGNNRYAAIKASAGYTVLNLVDSNNSGSYLQYGNSSVRRGSLHFDSNSDFVITVNASNSGVTLTERLRIRSDGQIDAKYGVINLGTADSSSGHINAYELMTFNIDSDNDDTNRHFTWYKNAASGAGTGMMRLNEDGRLIIGGDLATSANNLTLKHATGAEIDMHATSGSGNNFRIKSDSNGTFTIRDHSAGADRLTITDAGNIGVGVASPSEKFMVKGIIASEATNSTNNWMAYTYTDNTFRLNYNGAGADEVTITSSGNFGIGDTNPSEKLNVAGNIMLEGAEGFMYLSNVGTGNAGIYVRGNSSGSFLRSHSTGMFTWEVTGSEKMRLTSDGNLGLGCDPGNSAGYRTLQIGDGSTSGGQIWLKNSNNSNFYIWNANGGSGTNFYNQSAIPLIFYTNSTHKMTIGATGQVEVSNTVSGNDAAVNIYKASGDNTDKAILRVGYDSAAAFEIYRIRNNGDIFAGPNQSGSDFIFQNRPTGGSIIERLRIQENGNIGVGGITPSFTTGGGIHLADAMAIGFGNGGNSRPDFQIATVNGTTLDFRCGNGADTADIQMTTDGKLRLGSTIASLAGDDCVKDMIAGRAMVNRFRRGTSNGTRFGTVTGYIGDMLSSDGVQMSHVFYMGQINSSSSSNATQNMFSYYTSGHWGQYTSMRVWMHTDYYNHGYQVWDVYNGSITSIASRGSGGNLTQSSTTVGSGTHSGQNVTRYNVTVENPGTYFQVRWYLGLYFGATMGVYSNAYSESSMDTYLSTRGSGIHFKGLSAAALSSCPMYRTQ